MKRVTKMLLKANDVPFENKKSPIEFFLKVVKKCGQKE
jgi:hypothetical protein